MRSRLVLLSVAVTSMVVVAFSIPLAVLVRDLAADRAITAAEREANALARTLAVVGDVSDATIEALIRGADDTVQLAVIRQTGDVIGDASGMSQEGVGSLSGRSLLREEDGGVASYVPVVGLDPRTSVRSWVGPSVLRRNVAAAWSVLAVLGVLLVGLAAILADRLGRSLVRPVEELAVATEQLAAGDLHVAVTPDGPSELASVGHAFNRLVARMRGLIAAERESIADLSHRLRTPLTALRLNAESLDGAGEVIEDVARLERTVDAIIAEARRPMRDAVAREADLVGIVRGRVVFWNPLASDQQRSIQADICDGPVLVNASEQDVTTVVDALLENVFAHTPEGSDLAVRVYSEGVLVVGDRGDGFVREFVVRGASGAGGTGLGLDIVRRTAEASGGWVAIGSRPGGGSLITVTFGVPE